jgi:predicted dienelactone hydrolase
MLLLLAACATTETPAPEAVDSPEALGPWAVSHTGFDITDAARQGRTLRLDVWFPVEPADAEGLDPVSYDLSAGILLPSDRAVAFAPPSRGAHPLIVFSHGYNGINTQAITLMEALASHGFVVASPEHTGNAQASPTDPYDTAARNRVPDVSFVIDELIARAADDDDLLYRTVDGERIGVAGHSFGGMTALGAASGWAEAPADPRVDAVMPISAVIQGDLQADDRPSPYAGFTAEQLASVTVPVMLMGGTEDLAVPIGNNQLACDGLTSAPAVYDVAIDGANHTHFANVCAIGARLVELGFEEDAWAGLGAGDLLEPYEATCSDEAFPVEEVLRLLDTFAVAFFRRHVLDEVGYDAWLTEAHADTEPDVALQVR